jgi:hypothetical protein
MTTWVKNHFRDPKHAMTTISVTSLAMAALGVGIFLLGAMLGR